MKSHNGWNRQQHFKKRSSFKFGFSIDLSFKCVLLIWLHTLVNALWPLSSRQVSEWWIVTRIIICTNVILTEGVLNSEEGKIEGKLLQFHFKPDDLHFFSQTWLATPPISEEQSPWSIFWTFISLLFPKPSRGWDTSWSFRVFNRKSLLKTRHSDENFERYGITPQNFLGKSRNDQIQPPCFIRKGIWCVYVCVCVCVCVYLKPYCSIKLVYVCVCTLFCICTSRGIKSK